MKRTLQAKLRKSIRCAEHNFRGLASAIDRHEQACGSLPEALRQFAVDLTENRQHRKFIATLVSKTRGTEGSWRAITEFAAETDDLPAKVDFLRICSARKRLDDIALEIFREVLTKDSLEEQVSAIDEVAMSNGRSARRVLIELMSNSSLPVLLRERATEMLHFHACAETVEACSRLLSDPNVSMRFWAAYTLGQCSAFRSGVSESTALALERALSDHEVAPGWWSVSREAQALITNVRKDRIAMEQLQLEIRQILKDPNASPTDRRWAEFYSRVAPTDIAALP